MQNWSKHRNSTYETIHALCAEPMVLTSSASGSVVISHTRCAAYEGQGQDMPYAVLGLCTGGGGRTRRQHENLIFDDVWQPGKVGLMLPGPAAKGFSPKMEMLAIAFDPHDVTFCHGQPVALAEMSKLCHNLFFDDLISAVMVAIMRDAEAHGAASAFFDHGLSLILNRLKKRASLENHAKREKLAPRKINHVLSIIHEQLDQDLRVKDLAELSGLNPKAFTRLFKQQTGYTPFMYLTKTRMEHAKILLQKDEHNITDTALAVGYANPAKFAAAFRRWVGTSPSGWRNSGY